MSSASSIKGNAELVFDWTKPSPLRFARDQDFFQPILLEFCSDSFMEDFLAAAGAPKPDGLTRFIAAPRSKEEPLKFFQPVHGRFYLVCASLGCRQPGFPDRVVQRANGEKVYFFLRKKINGEEYGWVPKDPRKGWQKVSDPAKTVLDREDPLPLAAVLCGNGRPIWYGYLPASSRETYSAAPSYGAAEKAEAAGSETDPRIAELEARFIRQLPLVPSAADRPTLSVYLLLDLYEFFEDKLKDVAEALRRNEWTPTFSGDQAQAKSDLMTFLRGQSLGGSLTLAEALASVAQNQAKLNAPGGGKLKELGLDGYDLSATPPNTDALEKAVRNALPAEPAPVELPKLAAEAQSRYVLRCVYERPRCCGPTEYTISRPSQPFQLGRFFDPDAPARPIKIPLPTDVSIAALRQAKKGVSFMLSNSMRKKMNSITGQEKNLLKDTATLAEGPDGLAFICSFSIQIIFIVAFFLLLIFVVVFNLIFWWLPFFRICIPIPKKWMPE
jgi:hypothetical protein